MGKFLMLSLVGLVALALSQGAILSSDLPSDNSVVPSGKDDGDWDLLGLTDKDTKRNDVNLADDDTQDDLMDDEEVEKELTKEEKNIGAPSEFPLDKLDDDSLLQYANLEDEILVNEADEHIGFQLLQEQNSLYTKGGDRLRRKRIAPLVARAAFAVGRSLFRRFARSGVTRSGSRITRHYNGNGNYNTALRDFNRMRPTNVRDFSGRISGRTGTMGPHRVTVRNGSSGNSRPTLEIRSHNGSLVRKFRYNN